MPAAAAGLLPGDRIVAVGGRTGRAEDADAPDKQARLIKLNRSLNKWQNQGRTQAHFFGVETNGVGYAMASSLKSKISAPVIGYSTVGSISSDKPVDFVKVSNET